MSAAKFTWDVSPTMPVDGYNVYIKEGLGGVTGFVKHNSSVIETTQYTATNLSPGDYQAYETAVRGTNESEPSNTVTFTIEFNNLYQPKNLQSVVVSSDVTLSWDYVPGITQYNVYLKTGAGAFVLQDTVNADEYEITGLSAEDYEWYVSSLYGGEEVDSDTKTFTVT